MRKDPDSAVDLLLKKQEADQFPLTRNVEKQSIDILIPLMETENSKFLSQDKKVWEENIDWMLQQGMIKEKISAEDVMIEL